jgi:predicted DNA-binding transcriptional regulator AlpA
VRDTGPRTTTTTNGLASIGPGGETLLLSMREAARMLGISERTLWSLTAPRGPIKCVRTSADGRVLYSRQSLVDWIAECEAASATEGGRDE